MEVGMTQDQNYINFQYSLACKSQRLLNFGLDAAAGAYSVPRILARFLKKLRNRNVLKRKKKRKGVKKESFGTAAKIKEDTDAPEQSQYI